jgi:hypothetical protein
MADPNAFWRRACTGWKLDNSHRQVDVGHMTKTMAEAVVSLAGIVADILKQRNEQIDLCLSPKDIASGIQMACADENMVRLVALGGLGSMLYDALQEWLNNYEHKRQQWLAETPAGRRILKERAPAVFDRVMKARKQHV